ncbi:MAG TPA: hypothetical protein VMF11_05855 [Candidatus Baltobacteraceae bacterium]|nr:hypothetical protein [Candidatus Baltobacteraceae bacterium]
MRISAFALVLVAAVTLAAAPKPPPIPNVADAVTQHSIVLGGKRIAYTARAGTITLRDDDRRPLATMFYTAYTADGVSARKRPITFFYNGGPGSSTIWLRMGSFGPVRADIAPNGGITPPAPFRLVDNHYSLLDTSDLVFIDMAASGYGRIEPGADAKEVFGSDNDANMFAQFITQYLTRFDRWNSPKFLYGESYGTPRSALLVNYLQNEGVSINGVVLQSSILNFSLASRDTYGGADTDDWQYVFYFATEAATAWYYHLVPGAPRDLDAYMREVERFAMGDYRRALLQGAQLPPASFDAMVSRLHHYLGVPERFIRNANLRISGEQYIAEVRRRQGESVGVYDARYRLFELDRAEEYPQLTPSNASIEGPYLALQQDYFRNQLHYVTPLSYRLGAYAVIAKSGPWNYRHLDTVPLNTAPDLAEAMTFNPHLRIFSANGYFDEVTPFLATVYTLNHLGIVPALQSNITYGFYPSGHMIYLNVDALRSYHDDLERWYRATLEER